jgi:hypothetical protein
MNCSRWWSTFGSPRSYKTVQSTTEFRRVQLQLRRDSPADKTFRTDSSENNKTRLLFTCNRFVLQWLVVARPKKGQIKRSVTQASPSYLPRYPGNTWQYLDRVCVRPQQHRRLFYRNFLTDLNWFVTFLIIRILVENLWISEARGSVLCWGTILQVGRSRVQFPMRSLDY